MAWRRGLEMDDYSAAITKVLNVLSGLAVVGTILGWFPYFVAVTGFIYYCLQIYNDPTTQAYLARRRARKIAKYERAISLLKDRSTRHDGT